MTVVWLMATFALVVLRGAQASWVAAPLSHFTSEAGEEGVRHFWHHDHCELDGGGHVSLQWSFQADPSSIFSLDTEHSLGVRMIRCQPAEVVLTVPEQYVRQLPAYRHLVASSSLHKCEHLRGEHLYHKIVRLVSVAHPQKAGQAATVVFETRDVGSASEVVVGAQFSFSYLPPEAVVGSPVKGGSFQSGRCSIKRSAADGPRRMSAAEGHGAADNATGQNTTVGVSPSVGSVVQNRTSKACTCTTGSGDKCKVCKAQSACTGSNQCEECNDGYELMKTTSTCQAFSCTTGSGAHCNICRAQFARTGRNQCEVCNAGYDLMVANSSCRVILAAKTPFTPKMFSKHNYTCVTGSGAQCKVCKAQSARTGDNQCEKCNSGYELMGTNSTCQATTTATTFTMTTTTTTTTTRTTTAEACPANSVGTNLGSGCSCNAGYSGTISASSSSPYYSGSCSAVACPANSVGTNAPGGCSCNAGYSGAISASSASPYYSGSCQAVTWYLSNRSCTSTCNNVKLTCSESHWPRSKHEFEAILSEMNYKRCKEIDPTTDELNPSEYGKFCAWKYVGASKGDRCEIDAIAGVRRFCPCQASLKHTEKKPRGKKATTTTVEASATRAFRGTTTPQASHSSTTSEACVGGSVRRRRATSCTSCKAGYYNSGNQDDCQACLGGAVRRRRAFSCTVCHASGYYNTGNSEDCQECVGGSVRRRRATICTACSAGHYNSGNDDDCQACPRGSVRRRRATACTACSAGFHSSSNNDDCQASSDNVVVRGNENAIGDNNTIVVKSVYNPQAASKHAEEKKKHGKTGSTSTVEATTTQASRDTTPQQTSHSTTSEATVTTWDDLGEGCCAERKSVGSTTGTFEQCKEKCKTVAECKYILYGWAGSNWCSMLSSDSSCSSLSSGPRDCGSSGNDGVHTYKKQASTTEKADRADNSVGKTTTRPSDNHDADATATDRADNSVGKTTTRPSDNHDPDATTTDRADNSVGKTTTRPSDNHDADATTTDRTDNSIGKTTTRPSDNHDADATATDRTDNSVVKTTTRPSDNHDTDAIAAHTEANKSSAASKSKKGAHEKGKSASIVERTTTHASAPLVITKKKLLESPAGAKANSSHHERPAFKIIPISKKTTTTTTEASDHTDHDLVITKKKLLESPAGTKANSSHHERSAFKIIPISKKTTTTTTTTEAPDLTDHDAAEQQSVLNFVPRKVANFGWNWNFKTGLPKEAEYKLVFPGGRGLVQLTHPYVRIHAGVTMNFSSKISPLPDGASRVSLQVGLKGSAHVGGDMEAIFNTSSSQASSTNLISSHFETTEMEPLEFFLGNIPVRISPGARLGLSASYLGELQGSMRLGLQGRTAFQAVLYFDTERGLRTDFKAEPLDGQFWPPSWLVSTRRFGLSALLQPHFWVNASVGQIRNAHLSMGLRPHLNVSLAQQSTSPSPSTPEAGKKKSLAIYPTRVVGLNPGEEYAVKVIANGNEAVTSTQIGFGVIEYSDNEQKFDFGLIGETDMKTAAIEVVLLRRGREPMANATAFCASHAHGFCYPSPIDVKLRVEGKIVIVQLKVFWKDNALFQLRQSLRSVSIDFQTMTATPHLSAKLLAAVQKSQSISFRLERNGRQFAVPAYIDATDKKAISLRSNVTYEFGSCWLENWKHLTEGDPKNSGITVPKRLQQLVRPSFSLLIGGDVVGRGELGGREDIWSLWEGVTANTAPVLRREYTDMGEAIAETLGSTWSTPIEFAVEDISSKKIIGNAKLKINILDLSSSSFWIYPYKAERLAKGAHHKLTWRIDTFDDGEEVAFALRAFKVTHEGALRMTRFLKLMKLPCRYGADPANKTYDVMPFGNHCGFSSVVDFGMPELLTGRFLFMLGWIRGEREHVMMSSPVDFVSRSSSKPHHEARLLKGRASSSSGASSPSEHLRISETKVDFPETLRELNPHCSGSPLSFNVTMDILVRNQILVHNLPHDRKEFGALSDFDTGWVPLNGVMNAMDKLAAALLLPKAICQDTVCQGMLPGCSGDALPKMQIPHLRFQFTRAFNWTAKSMEGLRHVLASGLGVLPDVLEFFADAQRESESAHEDSQEQGNSHNRRLTSSLLGTHSKWFVARLTSPLAYNVNSQILEYLLHIGAWRGVSDGQESAQGPVGIHRVRIMDGGVADTSASSSRQFGGIVGGPLGFVVFGSLCACLMVSFSVSRIHSRQFVLAGCSPAIGTVEYAAVPVENE